MNISPTDDTSEKVDFAQYEGKFSKEFFTQLTCEILYFMRPEINIKDTGE